MWHGSRFHLIPRAGLCGFLWLTLIHSTSCWVLLLFACLFSKDHHFSCCLLGSDSIDGKNNPTPSISQRCKPGTLFLVNLSCWSTSLMEGVGLETPVWRSLITGNVWPTKYVFCGLIELYDLVLAFVQCDVTLSLPLPLCCSGWTRSLHPYQCFSKLSVI